MKRCALLNGSRTFVLTRFLGRFQLASDVSHGGHELCHRLYEALHSYAGGATLATRPQAATVLRALDPDTLLMKPHGAQAAPYHSGLRFVPTTVFALLNAHAGLASHCPPINSVSYALERDDPPATVVRCNDNAATVAFKRLVRSSVTQVVGDMWCCL